MLTSIEKKFIFIFLVQFMADGTVAAPIRLTISTKQNDTVVAPMPLTISSKQNNTVGMFNVMDHFCYIVVVVLLLMYCICAKRKIFRLSKLFAPCRNAKRVRKMRCLCSSFWNSILRMQVFSLNQEKLPEEQGLIEENEDLEQHLNSLIIENQNLKKEYEDLRQHLNNVIIEKQNQEIENKDIRQELGKRGIVLEEAWRKIQEMEINIVLDSVSAHPDVSVDADALQVRFVGNTRGPDRWYYVAIAEGLPTRNHYWEVEVGEKSSWAIGVVTTEIKKMKTIPETPGDGLWLVRLCRGKKFEALSNTVTDLQEKPKKVGVFLGENYLSFYNAENAKHIYTFQMQYFEHLFPVFSPGSSDRGPLIIKKSKLLTDLSNTA